MYHNHRHCRHDHGDSGIGCLLMALVGIFAMPFVGLYLALQGNGDEKAIGIFLMVVGIVIWIVAAA